MTRRTLVALSAAAPLVAADSPPVKLGIDLFSLRSQNWTPIQYLDYCAARKARVVHFSEIRFIGSLEPGNLRQVRRRAEELGIEIEIGMRSICPISTLFDAKAGTAQEQLGRMIDAARIVGSRIVRAVLGSSEDRRRGPMERYIDSTVGVLRSMRSRVMDAGLHVAIENHSGDMQSWELKSLIEAAGREFVGACIDSGNPLWTLEDPHVTLDTLHPYALTSHVRDSAVWPVANGGAVAWVRMGEGNVDIEKYVLDYARLCPGKALSLESIVTGPRVFAYREPQFWDAYRDIPAWEFERFREIADRGKPLPDDPKPPDREAALRKEREDLDASIHYVRGVLGI